MSDQSQAEDPVAHAGQKITSYVSVAAVAAEALAQLAAHRARERAVSDERAAAALRAQRAAAYGQARTAWGPVLDPRQRDRTTALDAGQAWAQAQAWRPDPEADRAAALAEDRLRTLRPDVMDRYDRLRGHGVDPVDAMRRVAPYFDQPAARTGDPGPDRAALLERDVARRAGDAELTLYRGRAAVLDDPRTARVDEHAAAAAQAVPHLHRGAGEHARAAAAAAGVADAPARFGRTPAGVAAEGYPKPIQAATVDAARAAAAGRPVTITTAQHRTTTAAAGRAR